MTMDASDTLPFLCEAEGFIERVPIGHFMAPDGAAYLLRLYEDGTVRFEHICDRGDRGIVVCSPALHVGPHGDGHRIVSRDPWHIEPSILCPDCGTHGFVRDGVWTPA